MEKHRMAEITGGVNGILIGAGEAEIPWSTKRHVEQKLSKNHGQIGALGIRPPSPASLHFSSRKPNCTMHAHCVDRQRIFCGVLSVLPSASDGWVRPHTLTFRTALALSSCTQSPMVTAQCSGQDWSARNKTSCSRFQKTVPSPRGASGAWFPRSVLLSSAHALRQHARQRNLDIPFPCVSSHDTIQAHHSKADAFSNFTVVGSPSAASPPPSAPSSPPRPLAVTPGHSSNISAHPSVVTHTISPPRATVQPTAVSPSQSASSIAANDSFLSSSNAFLVGNVGSAASSRTSSVVSQRSHSRLSNIALAEQSPSTSARRQQMEKQPQARVPPHMRSSLETPWAHTELQPRPTERRKHVSFSCVQ